VQESPLTQLILDTAMNAFVSMDTDGLVTEWNRSAEQIFGYSKQEALGRPVAELVMPERYREAHRQGLQRFLETGEGPVLGRRLELQGLRADGSEFPIELTIQSLEHAGAWSFHAFIADVTLRREAEQALKQANDELRRTDELKSQFLAMASHELRTPLTAIEGFTSTMLHRWDELSDDEKVGFLEIVDVQSRRLSQLVDDLLTLSRVESGKLHVDRIAVDLSLLTRRVLRELDLEGRVAVEGADDNVVALADETLLAQIVINFVSNAYKYGQPPFEVVLRENEGWVELSVCDHGPGVPAEFLDHLFEPFARARHDGSAPPGSGLGLSIVRGLAEAQGGDAWYEHAEGAGARFSVRVPRAAG